MSTVVKDLGAVSAYAYAVEKGYTGTEAEFAELMADYAEVGQRAEDAADSALESKTAAQTAATTATNKATEATTAATTATTKASEASTSASTATSAKDTAVSASQTATTKATEATTAAATATSAATTATTAKDDAVSAKTAAQTAQTGAETAAASVEASAAQITTNAEDISQLKSDLTQMFDPTPIYTLVDSSLITEKTNTFLLGGVEYSNNLWRTMTLAVEGGKEYRITAAYYSSIKCVTYFDENDTYISEAESSPTDAVHTVTITTPANAAKMSINDKKSSAFAVYTVGYAFKDSLLYIDGNPIDTLAHYANVLGVEIGSNKWSIGTGKFKNIVELYGSANNAFKYNSVTYNDASFKGVDDDITPINTNCGYIGANHGYNYGYKATLANHGLTVADIGKTCEINGDTWVLVQVLSTSQFVVLCRSESNWWGAKAPSTVPTTFNFGSSITVTSIARDQIRPSITNVSVSIKENSYKTFTVYESYDIINLASGISAIIDNVGDNDNSSIATMASDPVLTVRNVYEFADTGSCVLVQNVKVNNAELLFSTYGGTQSAGFANNNYYAIPMTQYDTIQAVSAEVNFVRTTWNDQTKPPLIYLQADGTGATANKMFLQGIEMSDRNGKISNNAGFVYTTAKMYPYAVAPASQLSVDETYSFMSYRIPMYANDIDEDVKFCGYCKVGNCFYFFCYNPTAVSKTITVPVELCGLNIETVIAKNASCLNSIVSTGIDVKITGEGYLLLKLS